MLKPRISAAFLAAAVAVFSCPVAAAIVSAGSSYQIYIKGETSLQEFFGTGTFDASASLLSRAGLDLTLTESQTDLGGGAHLITINLSANGDLFPSAGEGGIFGMGVFGNGLDLLQPVYLDDARINLYTSSGLYFSTTNLADDYRGNVTDPWDGNFFQGLSFIIGNSGGHGVNAFSFDFQVSAIPEPESYALMLAGLGLLGFVARRRRKLTSPN